MSTKLVVLRNGQRLFEYELQAGEEKLPGQTSLALAVFRCFNPTVNLFDPEISVKFEKVD
jgi:hypothetical protein